MTQSSNRGKMTRDLGARNVHGRADVSSAVDVGILLHTNHGLVWPRQPLLGTAWRTPCPRSLTPCLLLLVSLDFIISLHLHFNDYLHSHTSTPTIRLHSNLLVSSVWR